MNRLDPSRCWSRYEPMNNDHFEVVKELPEIKILPENVVSNRRVCVCVGSG